MHPFKEYNSVIFNIVTTLCNRHHCLILEHSHHPKGNPLPISSHSLFSTPIPLPHPTLCPASNNHSFIFSLWKLPILDVCYTWSHMTCSLLCLDSFKAHPCYSLCQDLTPFRCWIIFRSLDIPYCVIHSSDDGRLVCFYFWLWWMVLLWTHVSKLLCGHRSSILLGMSLGVELVSLHLHFFNGRLVCHGCI